MSLRTFGWSRTRTGWLAPLCTLPVRQSINALYIYLLTPGNKLRYGWEKLFEKGATQCLENSVTMLYYLKLTASMILLNFLWPDISQWQFYLVISKSRLLQSSPEQTILGSIIMASVWKRLQRVGKHASKFQFVASYQELMVECTKKW